MTKVLFVCLGNICRSPMAEAIFISKCKEKNLTGFQADSAGTASYHIGANPDPRTMSTLADNNIPINHKARQFVSEDFDQFDYIIAMDQSNYRDIKDMANRDHEHLFLMRAFDSTKGNNMDVPDPYYGGVDGFNNVYNILSDAIDNLIDHMLKNR